MPQTVKVHLRPNRNTKSLGSMISDMERRMKACGDTFRQSVIDASNDILQQIMLMYDWSWLYDLGVITTSANVAQYSLADDCEILLPHPTLNPYGHLPLIDVSVFQDAADNANTVQSGAPQICAKTGDNLISFWPTPDAVYTINYPYKKTYGELSDDSDTPSIPATMTPIWRAGVLAMLRTDDDRFDTATAAAARAYETLLQQAIMNDAKGVLYSVRTEEELGWTGLDAESFHG